LIGAEVEPWLTGIPEDIFRVQRALADVYGMIDGDVQVMLDLPCTPPHLVPSVINVWCEVYKALKRSDVGDDVLLYIACH
jgi:hypothetical protein